VSRLLPAAVFALSTLTPAGSPGAASAPALRLACGVPNSRNVVTCRLSGSGFHAREAVRITYRITFTALPLQHGKRPQQVYHRTARTDRAGRFVRPALGFAVVRYHESFRMVVTATGATGDGASITYTAIAQ
jgi:hypothetical protein